MELFEINTDSPIQKSQWKRILPLVALAAIVLLAATLRLIDINSLGYVNHYYAAAVKSMLQSWHNFFFAVAEPGGSVMVDKPPVGLWLQTISAYFLGVNTLGLLMPQILAGLGSVVLVYHLIRRSFGEAAGLIAALALAVMPVAVAVDRNNTIDSTMIFTLLLAAWTFIKATESSKLRYLMLGAFLVGVAFNIKMLAAFLPLPAFFALYFLGASEGIWRKVAKLALTVILLLAVSLSWAVAVDLTPEDQRPFVGSSEDNSEITLIVGYNGLNRLLGMARNGNGAPAGNERVAGAPQPGSAPSDMAAPARGFPAGPMTPGNGTRPSAPTRTGRPQNNPGQPGGNRMQGGGRTPSNIGSAGPLRLFTSPLSKEASWLLPVALLGIILLLAGTRLQWTLAAKHQAAILWGGWLITGGIFFSIASYFHEYYLTLLGAPTAALAGIGIVELWRLRKNHPLFTLILTLTVTSLTFAFQFYTAYAFVDSIRWLLPTIGAASLGAGLLIVASRPFAPRQLALAGISLLMLSLFITPGIWSVYTALNPGSNLSLPAAYSGRESSPSNRGNVRVNESLLDYLEANTQDVLYLMAVPSSMQGADYVLASGRPVLYIGGFKGSDEVVSAQDLAQLVAEGKLRYIYWGSQGGGGNSEISTWAASACTPVQGFNTTTRNAGAPDGTASGPNSAQGGDQRIALYDCAANIQ
ncbi:MAG TPA: glycosyltransferase family 39 protein [Anaerolineales bacterium]|nr:glycosyltransferase family 39 protein [Anaerolineales bacterium]